MCTTCSVVGCRNVSPTAGISFHSFPKDPETRRLWLVALKRDRWEPKASSCVCSAHFTKDDYEYDPGIALRMGMKPFSRLLKRGAVPSVFGCDQEATRPRGAFEKRRRKEIVEEAIAAYASQAGHPRTSRLCEERVKSFVSVGTNTGQQRRNQGMMTERPMLRNRFTDCQISSSSAYLVGHATKGVCEVPCSRPACFCNPQDSFIPPTSKSVRIICDQ